jgi:DMSO/TMAO reductase YedYZ molybdopterin-dependent catalytic subunit
MNRRSWLKAMLTGAGAATLASCDKLTTAPRTLAHLRSAETFNYKVQRLIGRGDLAPEFAEHQISKYFKPNGSISPGDAEYRKDLLSHWADWRLEVTGLVDNPLSLSLAELRQQPARTQITRHDCVEGWSCIGKWTGAKLGPLLDLAKIRPQAKFLVFYCMDTLSPADEAPYYESIDMVDARHPQTILAYEMNGAALPVQHGAPLRLRVERQLGYKQAKYIRRIEAVADFSHVQSGRGGYWEDRGYEWFAGI